MTDCTTHYNPVLSSDRAPKDEEQRNFPAKERKKVKSGHRPQRGVRHQDMLTDWLTASRKVTSTSINLCYLFKLLVLNILRMLKMVIFGCWSREPFFIWTCDKVWKATELLATLIMVLLRHTWTWGIRMSWDPVPWRRYAAMTLLMAHCTVDGFRPAETRTAIIAIMRELVAVKQTKFVMTI
jgi:hypothetical protein